MEMCFIGRDDLFRKIDNHFHSSNQLPALYLVCWFGLLTELILVRAKLGLFRHNSLRNASRNSNFFDLMFGGCFQETGWYMGVQDQFYLNLLNVLQILDTLGALPLLENVRSLHIDNAAICIEQKYHNI